MRELTRYKCDFGEVGWLYDEQSEEHTIEIECQGLYKKLGATYDVAEALQAYLHAVYSCQ
jgi:hypothetical protein